MASPALEMKNVELRFRGEALLRPINLQIAEQEAVVLIGPSGHGKSVILKMLAGLLRPTGGEVHVRGRSLYAISDTERAKVTQQMGMLFQKNALFDSLSVGENVAFPLRELTELSEVEIQKKVDFFLDAVGILHARALFPDEISGGMQKRLGIARALVLQPQIVFYDDPTAGLDPITSRKIVQLIGDLRKQNGSTIVTITNDMNRAYQLADRIAMVVEGELVFTGSPAETQAHSDPRVQQFIRGRLEGPLAVQA